MRIRIRLQAVNCVRAFDIAGANDMRWRMAANPHLAANIEAIMAVLETDQKGLAARLKTDQATVSRWGRATTPRSAAHVLALAKLGELTPDELLGRAFSADQIRSRLARVEHPKPAASVVGVEEPPLDEVALAPLVAALLPSVPKGRATESAVRDLAAALAHGLELLAVRPAKPATPERVEMAVRGVVALLRGAAARA